MDRIFQIRIGWLAADPQGNKPAELPIQQAAKVELHFNLKTAKTLGITVPNTLIGRADEVFD